MAASADHPVEEQYGFLHTYIKLEFKPNFGLTDTGPQGEDAIAAWEATMHEIYFLGGGSHISGGEFSETHWGRIIGTENQVLIGTGRCYSGSRSKFSYFPLIPKDDSAGVLSFLAPYLLHAPKIINICWEQPAGNMHRKWAFACDLNLFHIPNIEPEEKSMAVYHVRSPTTGYGVEPHSSSTELQDASHGVLFFAEGIARSFAEDDNSSGLEDKKTYAHLTVWTNRELSESYKDPNQDNIKDGHCRWRNDFYQDYFAARFQRAEEERGVVREEIQVDFKRWGELWPDYQQAEYAARYPGSIPTHPEHSKDCEKCAPWVD